MKIVIFGSSIVSSHWNGAATYYRGICKALHARGHRIVFVEPDIYDRQQHRDLLEDPPYAEVRICRGWDDLARELEDAHGADLVAKFSGVGGWDMDLARGVLDLQSPETLVVFWDVDAPATLAAAFGEPPGQPNTFRALVARYDAILLYGGGPPVQASYAQLGAGGAFLIYNAVDLDEYFPVPPEPDRACDLLFMGNRMPDREQRVRDLFFGAAEVAPELQFALGGAGWGEGIALPPNVRWIGHVPTADHRAWNCSARMVLNVVREGMAAYGYSPPTRVFEVAGCGACLITDAWAGVEEFFEPGREILVAMSAEDIVRHLRSTPEAEAREIGRRARDRAARHHTYDSRAAAFERVVAGLRRSRGALATPLETSSEAASPKRVSESSHQAQGWPVGVHT